MMNTVPLPSIFDTSGLAAIKRQAKANDPAALKAAAQQFEAMFLQMVLKSMRDATPREGMFDNDQTRLYESLLDQQMSQVLASKGGTGLAKLIESQLSRNAGSAEPTPLENLPLPLADMLRQSTAPARSLPLSASDAKAASPNDFVGRIWPHAVEAGRSLGVRPEFLIGQAALETGWGRAEPKRADGHPSYNLFGVKAGRNWTGDTAEATTTEYVDGVAQQRVERFRAYGSYAEAFRDYAGLLSSNTRYASVLGATDAVSFARGLQRAGYATDPAYADKLARVIGGLAMQEAPAA
jgi:flagellar protein FlgJ